MVRQASASSPAAQPWPPDPLAQGSVVPSGVVRAVGSGRAPSFRGERSSPATHPRRVAPYRRAMRTARTRIPVAPRPRPPDDCEEWRRRSRAPVRRFRRRAARARSAPLSDRRHGERACSRFGGGHCRQPFYAHLTELVCARSEAIESGFDLQGNVVNRNCSGSGVVRSAQAVTSAGREPLAARGCRPA